MLSLSPSFEVPVVAQWRECITLFDSGATDNLISLDLREQLPCRSRPLRHPFLVRVANCDVLRVDKYLLVQICLATMSIRMSLRIIPMTVPHSYTQRTRLMGRVRVNPRRQLIPTRDSLRRHWQISEEEFARGNPARRKSTISWLSATMRTGRTGRNVHPLMRTDKPLVGISKRHAPKYSHVLQ